MTTVHSPFSPIDEVLHLTDSDQYPVNVHIEVKAPGELDAEAMRDAVHKALAVHPLARARLVRPSQRDKQLQWEIMEAPRVDPFLVVEAGDDASVNRARNQLLSTRVPLHEAPPLRVWLVRCNKGDHLILNVSHAAADGIGTLRFLRSILRAYCGEEDDTGSVDPLQSRDLEALYGPKSRTEKTRRFKSYAASMKTQMPEATSISELTDSEAIAYGCYHYTLDVDDVSELNPKRYMKATFNDLLVAAMHRTVEVWNERLGDESSLVRVTSPVNLRPQEWWFEVFGNFAISFATNTELEQREDPEALMATVVEQSRTAKEEGFAESMLLGLSMGSRLPVWAKNLIFMSPGESGATSAALTNAGRITEALSFGQDGEAQEVWMSPPAVMPDGLGLGVTSYNGCIHLSFRHSYELLDDEAVADFAALFHESLLWLS
ncbi:MAG: hypothetical protein HOC23_01415 [Halieaceae bacterium]|jgi:NRPS condensation-like uncharacterized protein|nr:hypothetical protein [Halieaceae bacterium]